ncbi:hypothetical protein WICMUC_005857 [Wickerhamomyces mucosus]|uniref:Amino acid transporter n=1 Tax=Wickerhamomyces mucosus TaxID=1378264 RepID=A0A9P8T2K0_9ASCO|nr:hypothetical protein WICMUC_005857 [Wickerhamomyces mucosus]
MSSLLNKLSSSLSNTESEAISKTNNLEKIESYNGESSDSDIQLNTNGAPVEKENPLGNNIEYISLAYLIINGVIGTGIFATPSSILKSIGSVGASYVLWVVGFIIASFKLLVYSEYSTYFKNRSGGDVTYLEQAYPNPPFLVPTTYAAVSVILSFLNSSAVAFGQYILTAADVEVTTWKSRGLAAGVLAFVCIIAALSTKWSIRISDFLGHVKIITLLFIGITGLVVLGGHTSIEDPKANFRNSWEGTTTEPNNIANAIIKVSFSYGGAFYAFATVSELPEHKRFKGYTRVVPAAFFFIFVTYILNVTAYFAGAGSIKEIKSSGSLIASTFFTNVFKTKAATKALNVLVAIAAFSHLIVAVVAHSRALRECGRQGVLPFRDFWVSTKPFGTPIGPIFVIFIVNLVVMIAPPAGDAYNFIVDVGAYSGYIFDFQLAVGLLLLRRQRKKAGLGYQGFRVPLPVLVLQILFQLFVLIMPLVPPKNKNGSLKGSDVSFFYATYCLVVYGLLAACFAYYVVWQFILPKIGGYEHRVETFQLENGELGNRVVSVKVEDLEEWDRTHVAGNKLSTLEPAGTKVEVKDLDEDVIAVDHPINVKY